MSKASPGGETESMRGGALARSQTKVIRGERMSTPDGTEHVPDLPRLGRFQAVAELGAGAMGTVYRAQDDVLGRAVAIKMLHAGNELELRQRFLREARAIGAVHHPHILAIYDAGTEGETPYLVVELASGGSLRDAIKAGPLSVDTVRHVGIQIARALGAAHAANLLHRDVKPANILCTQDRVWKLADFGIARLPDSTLTVTGQFLGSPSYAAPESLRAGEFSPASDVYGLGATLYEALTGAPPHGDHDIQSLVRKLEQDPPPLRGRVAVPGALGDAIMASLARDPEQRPSADQLAHLLASSSEFAPRAVAPPAVGSRTRKLAITGIVAAALLITLLATRGRSHPALQVSPVASPPTSTGSGTVQASDPAAPNAPEDPTADPSQPTVVDQYGNPVDEETARRVLDQIERDSQDERGARGWGKRKHKGRGD